MSILRLITLFIVCFACVSIVYFLRDNYRNTEHQDLEININISFGAIGDSGQKEYLNHKIHLTEPRNDRPWFTRTTTRRRTGVGKPQFSTDFDREINGISPPTLEEIATTGNTTDSDRVWNVSYLKSVAFSVYGRVLQIVNDVKDKSQNHFGIWTHNFYGLLIDCCDKVQATSAAIVNALAEAAGDSKNSAEEVFRSFKDRIIENIDNGIARVYYYFVPESPVERKCKGHSNWYAKSACTLLFHAAEYPPQLVSTLAEGYDRFFEVATRLFVRESHKDKVCKSYDTVPFLRKVCETGFDVASMANDVLENVQEFIGKFIAQPTIDFAQKVITTITDSAWKAAEGFSRACHNGMHLGNRITTYIYQSLDIEAAKALLYSVLKKAAHKVHDVYVRLPRFNGDPIHDGLVVVAWVVCALAQGLVVYWAKRKISLDNNVRKARQMRLRATHPISSEDYYDRIARLIREQEGEEKDDTDRGDAERIGETESVQLVDSDFGVSGNNDKDVTNPTDDFANDSGVWADMSLGHIVEEEDEEEQTVPVPAPSAVQPVAVEEERAHANPKPEVSGQLLVLKDDTTIENREHVHPAEDKYNQEQSASVTTSKQKPEGHKDACKDGKGELNDSGSYAVALAPESEPEPAAASYMDKNNNDTESYAKERVIETGLEFQEGKVPTLCSVPDVNMDDARRKLIISEALKRIDSWDLPPRQATESSESSYWGNVYFRKIGRAAWIVFKYILEHPELF